MLQVRFLGAALLFAWLATGTAIAAPPQDGGRHPKLAPGPVGHAPLIATEKMAPRPEREPGEPRTLAELSEWHPFAPEFVERLARATAAREYMPPKAARDAGVAKTYDNYRKIWFKPDAALWRDSPGKLEMHPLPQGWLYGKSVMIYTVAGAEAYRYRAQLGDFHNSAELGNAGDETPLSGFRINGPINNSQKKDEIIVFQGASYFRALAKSLVYGVSGRGIAIRTGDPRGEEFPDFRVFWIEKPAGNGKKFRIHALLDGPSLTGAYRFDVTPGKQTVIKVKAVLFPRRKIATIGLAPLTSMFLLGPSDPVRVSDYRPHVHDSGGLAILTSERERIWRPLANPRNLQMSAFLDRAVRGFGLIQRNRNYASFLDLEARYHKRPSVWVNFDKSLGNGRIVLVEIPTENEFHDNIVAFWRPEKPVAANNALRFNYTMYWSELPPWHGSIPWVASTRSGLAHLKGGKTAVRFVVEYRWLQQYSATQIPKLVVTASRGRIQAPTVQRNPQTGGLRVTFLFHPGKEGIADLRANLGAWNGRTPETWIYRWNR